MTRPPAPRAAPWCRTLRRAALVDRAMACLLVATGLGFFPGTLIGMLLAAALGWLPWTCLLWFGVPTACFVTYLFTPFGPTEVEVAAAEAEQAAWQARWEARLARERAARAAAERELLADTGLGLGQALWADAGHLARAWRGVEAAWAEATTGEVPWTSPPRTGGS